MQTYLSLARSATLAGAAVIEERSGDIGAVRVKGDPTDIVTETDIETGVAVAKHIAQRLPTASFVIEEDEVYERAGVARGSLDDAEVWVIDPLDGTTSFVHGYPCYSISVALLHDGVPVVGVVYNVPAKEIFSAAEGEGAFLDGHPISCKDSHWRIEDALLITGFPYDRTTTLDRQLEVLARFLRVPAHGIRRDGSAAVDCCHVACGRADGFWEFGLHAWDTAAGVLILKESGARVTDITGVPWSTEATGIIAANPTLHALMLEVISEVR